MARQSSMKCLKNTMHGSLEGLRISSKYALYRLAMSGEQVAPIEMPHICSYVTEACLINNRDFTAICIHMMIVCLSCCGTPSQSANSKIHQDAHEFEMESQIQLSFNPPLSANSIKFFSTIGTAQSIWDV